MKEMSEIISLLEHRGAKPKVAEFHAKIWAENVARIPIGILVRHVIFKSTGITADGGFYNNPRLKFPITNIDGEEGINSNWSIYNIEVVASEPEHKSPTKQV